MKIAKHKSENDIESVTQLFFFSSDTKVKKEVVKEFQRQFFTVKY